MWLFACISIGRLVISILETESGRDSHRVPGNKLVQECRVEEGGVEQCADECRMVEVAVSVDPICGAAQSKAGLAKL